MNRGFFEHQIQSWILVATLGLILGISATPVYSSPEGQPVPAVSEAQLRSLERATRKGSVTAMVKLAGLYLSGGAGQRAPDKAESLYRKAAALGDPDAIFHLGNMYLLGDGIPKDEHQAFRLFEQAAAQGHPLAIQNYESLQQILLPQNDTPNHNRRQQDTTLDERRALEIARRYGVEVDLSGIPELANGIEAINRPSPEPDNTHTDSGESDVRSGTEIHQLPGESDFVAAEQYYSGNEIGRDEAKAITLYRRAARAGHPKAIRRLIDIYQAAGLPAPRCKNPSADDEICF